MKYKTHNQKDINTVGTSLKGSIDISYREIVNILGEPRKADKYRADALWQIEFKDKILATIYNYKNGKNYLGDQGIKTVNIRDWHIGGKFEDVVKLIYNILKPEPKNLSYYAYQMSDYMDRQPYLHKSSYNNSSTLVLGTSVTKDTTCKEIAENLTNEFNEVGYDMCFSQENNGDYNENIPTFKSEDFYQLFKPEHLDKIYDEHACNDCDEDCVYCEKELVQFYAMYDFKDKD